MARWVLLKRTPCHEHPGHKADYHCFLYLLDSRAQQPWLGWGYFWVFLTGKQWAFLVLCLYVTRCSVTYAVLCLCMVSFSLLQTISTGHIYLPRMSGTFRWCQVWDSSGQYRRCAYAQVYQILSCPSSKECGRSWICFSSQPCWRDHDQYFTVARVWLMQMRSSVFWSISSEITYPSVLSVVLLGFLHFQRFI